MGYWIIFCLLLIVTLSKSAFCLNECYKYPLLNRTIIGQCRRGKDALFRCTVTFTAGQII